MVARRKIPENIRSLFAKRRGLVEDENNGVYARLKPNGEEDSDGYYYFHDNWVSTRKESHWLGLFSKDRRLFDYLVEHIKFPNKVVLKNHCHYDPAVEYYHVRPGRFDYSPDKIFFEKVGHRLFYVGYYLIGNDPGAINRLIKNYETLKKKTDKALFGDDDEFKDFISRITRTEKDAIVKARIQQGPFKKALLEKWGACPLTRISNKKLLIASHIKDWKVSSNFERHHIENGILLSPNADKLFDRKLITFLDSGKMIYNKEEVSASDLRRLGISVNSRMPVSKGMKFYLKEHRKEFERKKKSRSAHR